MDQHASVAFLHGILTLLIKSPVKLSILKRSLGISFVVGTVLNIVNQGSDIAVGDSVQWFSFALNYLVPFCVATYSAWANDRRSAQARID